MLALPNAANACKMLHPLSLHRTVYDDQTQVAGSPQRIVRKGALRRDRYASIVPCLARHTRKYTHVKQTDERVKCCIGGLAYQH